MRSSAHASVFDSGLDETYHVISVAAMLIRPVVLLGLVGSRGVVRSMVSALELHDG